VDSRGRTIFAADAHCGDGQRFVVRADEKLTAFVELEAAAGDFADSLPVFAAPKRIGLKSHMRLSGVLVKSSLITSPDVSTDLNQAEDIFPARFFAPSGPVVAEST